MKISFAIKYTGIALAVCLCSCKKTLKEFNPSGVTAETVFTTPEGFETLVHAAYSFNKSWYGKEEGIGMSEGGTDLWTAGSETMVASSGLALENRSLILYQNMTPINQNITRLWRQLYAAVNLCNTGINIGTEKGFNAGRIAELKFLRAFYYWHIVETWGGVHLTTEETKSAITTANRTPVEKFYELIFSDLRSAIETLENTNAPGRVSKPVAEAFLARMYLTRGMNTEAKDLANKVITSYGYSLNENYSDLWNMAKQKDFIANSEVIWAVNYSSDPNNSDVYNEITNPYGYGYDILSAGGSPTNNRGNNNLHTVFVPTYDRSLPEFGGTKILNRDVRGGWPFNRLKPTKYLMDLFDETKDSRYAGSFQTMWKVNFNVTRAGNKLVGKTFYVDTALVITKNPAESPNYYTVNVYDTYNADGTSIDLNRNLLYPSLWKFQDSTRATSPDVLGNGNVQSAKDVFIIRLAEMYLIAAEAAINLGQTGEATTRINELRTKRALPGKEADMMVGDADMNIDFILDERAREFAGENIRWFDLKRTGKLISRVKEKNPDVGAYISDFHVVRPIPQAQLDVVTNRAEFIQNTGY